MTPVNVQQSSSTPTRPPATISPNLDKGLLGYAAAATAAGVGMLALAQSAEAKIIYTPANLVVHRNAGLVQFDVNNDGIPDFGIYSSSGLDARTGARVRPPLGGYARWLEIAPAQAANAVGEITSVHGSQCAGELHAGLKVGPGKNFQAGGIIPMFFVAGDYTSPGTPHCQWNGNSGGYLGLRFVVSGKTYYGWAHVSLTTAGPTITGYAYENVPGKSILTGATSGPDESASAAQTPALQSTTKEFANLGLLACGSSGLSLWRKPEETN